jgi:hypothetical protein
MYGDSTSDYGPVSVALSAALREHGWRMRHFGLPSVDAMQSDLPLCTFYTAFAVLLVACNAPEATSDVLRMLHDDSLRDVMALRFRRFVSYLAWVAVRRRLRKGGEASVLSQDDEDGYFDALVTGVDAGKRCLVYKDAFGHVHRASPMRTCIFKQ